MSCPVCGKDFLPTTWNRKYCCYDCRDRKIRVMKCSNPGNLSDDDLDLRKRMLHERQERKSADCSIAP